MKISREIKQGSPQWFQAKCGLISASHAHEVVTPAKLTEGAANAYCARLVAERHLGKPADTTQASQAMERGIVMEKKARDWAAFQLNVDIEEVGLITTNDGRFLCSPDGIIAETAGVEIKCRMVAAHTAHLLEHIARKDDPTWYDKGARLQIQMGLWITGWPKWYYIGYCPDSKTILREYGPEPEVQDALTKFLPKFDKRVDDAVAAIRGMDDREGLDADGKAAAVAFDL